MIKRKLNEAYNNTLKTLNESYEKNDGFTNRDLTTLYTTLFEDVTSAKYIFIHNRFNEDCDELLGHELFEEVTFTDGDKHYFISECYNGKTEVNEVKPTASMLKYKEYC